MTEFQPVNLPDDDESVLSFKHGVKSGVFTDNAIIGSVLKLRIRKIMSSGMIESESVHLMAQGLDCKRLAPGSSGWVSGKLRLTLEFVPDQPEIQEPNTRDEASPLDDLRQSLSSN